MLWYWGYLVGGTACGYDTLWVRVFLKYVAMDPLEFARAPGPFGDRGGMPSWRHGADGGVCRLLYAVHQILSLGLCTVAARGAPSHNRWGVVERRLPVKTQERNAGCILTSRHQVLLQGGFKCLASCAEAGKVPAQTHEDCGGSSCHGSAPGHSDQAGNPRRATNPLIGGHRPKKRLLRQVSPPGSRGTVADGPSRCQCTYQRCFGNAGHMVPTQGGHPSAGDRPEERRAPTQRLEGTNPRTGRRFFFSLSVTASSSWTSAIACSKSWFPSGLGPGVPVLCAAWLPVTYSWFSSLRSCGVFRLFSSRRFSSALTEQSNSGDISLNVLGRVCQAVSVVTSDRTRLSRGLKTTFSETAQIRDAFPAQYKPLLLHAGVVLALFLSRVIGVWTRRCGQGLHFRLLRPGAHMLDAESVCGYGDVGACVLAFRGSGAHYDDRLSREFCSP